MKKINGFVALLIFLLVCIPIFTIAQPADPCPDPSLKDCPIDSSLYILFGFALFFAIKKTFFLTAASTKRSRL